MIACGPEVDEQERQYVFALKNVVSYQVVDGRLDLLDASGATVLTFTALDG